MKKNYSNIISSSWGVLIFVTLLVSIPSTIIFLRDYADKKQDLLKGAETKTSWIQQYFESEYSNVLKDLEFFSRNPGYADYLKNTNEKSYQKIIIEKTTSAFTQIRNSYYQFRLLDTLGNEVLKIKLRDSIVDINADLQNKSHRPYLKIGQSLGKNEVYISDFDLNREQGKIEKPFRPVVRFLTPIFDNETKVGYLILNYNASRVLSKMEEINPGTDGKLLFATQDGRYIRAQGLVNDFTFLLDPNDEMGRVDKELITIWQKDSKQTLEHQDFGLSYYQSLGISGKVEIPKSFRLVNTPIYFISIGYTSGSILGVKKRIAFDLFLWDLLVLVVMVPIILILLNTIRQKTGQLDEKSKDLQARNKELERSKEVLSRNLDQVNRLSKEREYALSTLQSREYNLKTAQEIARLGYYERSLVSNRSTWSENLASIYGVPKNYNFNTKGVRPMMKKEDYAEVEKYWNECIDEKKEFKTFYRVVLESGEIRYVQDIAQPVVQNGEVVSMRGTVQNITERIKVEEELRNAKVKAEAATQAKSDFLATMSHEIRTPLNAVLGMASLLNETELDEKQDDFVNTIKVSGNALLGVINDILDFSKMESGLMEFENRALDLNGLVEDCLQVVAVSAEKKKLKLFYRICKGSPKIILGDEGRLRQCLINLLNNAVKFTDKGEVKILICVEEKNENKVKLKFSVIDTGIGIDKEKQGAIFNAFQQADTSITRRYGGTGLGLSITQRLVSLMGGQIFLKSEPYEGSEFYFIIETTGEWEQAQTSEVVKTACVISAENNESKALIETLEELGVKTQSVSFESNDFKEIDTDFVFILSEPELRNDFIQLGESLKPLQDRLFFVTNIQNGLSELKSFRVVSRPVRVSWLHDLIHLSTDKVGIESKKEAEPEVNTDLNILVAEDNPVNQKLTVLLFENLGFQIDLAETGLLAVKAAQNKKYDLVFMDIQMPEMDGVEAAKYILADHGSNAPKIIALTANAMQGDRDKYLKVGMSDYLSKPINVEELKEKIVFWGNQK